MNKYGTHTHTNILFFDHMYMANETEKKSKTQF